MNLILAQRAWQAENTDKNKEIYIRTINHYCLNGRIDKNLAELLLREVLTDEQKR